MTLYKVLNEDVIGQYSGVQWNLPRGNHPGDWMPNVEGELSICENGYHLCREQDLVYHLGPEIYEIESASEVLEVPGHTDKVLTAGPVRLIRKIEAWNERTARLCAADFAEHVLHIYENKFPGDSRARKTIEAGRLYANGKIDKEALARATRAAEVARVAGIAWAAGAAGAAGSAGG